VRDAIRRGARDVGSDLLLNGGKIEQQGTPQQMYSNPDRCSPPTSGQQ
jgi:ABC-type histidine transport system ATPase subunit